MKRMTGTVIKSIALRKGIYEKASEIRNSKQITWNDLLAIAIVKSKNMSYEEIKNNSMKMGL